MGEIPIDKDVPMPAPRHVYPWHRLDVGDSFVAPIEARYQTAAIGKRLGVKFATEKIGPDECRIWRVL